MTTTATAARALALALDRTEAERAVERMAQAWQDAGREAAMMADGLPLLATVQEANAARRAVLALLGHGDDDAKGGGR